jgi:hypothetical protein
MIVVSNAEGKGGGESACTPDLVRRTSLTCGHAAKSAVTSETSAHHAAAFLTSSR